MKRGKKMDRKTHAPIVPWGTPKDAKDIAHATGIVYPDRPANMMGSKGHSITWFADCVTCSRCAVALDEAMISGTLTTDDNGRIVET